MKVFLMSFTSEVQLLNPSLMAQVSISTTIFFLVAIFSAVAVSPQEEFTAPAPAPTTMETGAAFSLPMCGAVLCSSIALSLLALLKH
ncbi:hypothetical protein IFM89_023184 [Coptis chinensis]|uniref:Uncharacterized protein n=1 Tax=Coptis chinensis TaxID=261450 RepID=A0A835M0E9_9MAGN|nr:hypothetical protein IFM89_023184 [Coptis chinensis]